MLLGLPLLRPKHQQYPPLSIIDLVVFLSTTTLNLIRLSRLSVLLETTATTLLYVIYLLPLELLFQRFLRRQKTYLTRITLLQDLAIRIVRHCFAYADTSIGRIFFSEQNIVGLHRRRMGSAFDRNIALYRDEHAQGYWIAPGRAQKLARGEANGKNGITLLYIHGGGFTLASPAFYLEFLLRLCEELARQGVPSPAIFCVSYSLVPEARFPTQLCEVTRAWLHLCTHPSVDTRSLGVAGDSAGSCLALSLMLYLREDPDERVAYPAFADGNSSDEGTIVQGSYDSPSRTPRYPPILENSQRIPKPSHAVLISPWASLANSADSSAQELANTDFLSPSRMNHFARLYSGAQKREKPAGLIRFVTAKTKWLFPSFPLLPPFLSPVSSRRNSVRARNGHAHPTRSRQRSGEKLNGRRSHMNGASSRPRTRSHNGRLKGGEDFDELSVILSHVEQCRVNPLLSPSDCSDQSWWARAQPTKGSLVQYGSGEVLSAQVATLAHLLRADSIYGGEVKLSVEPLPHAWSIMNLYLAETEEQRGSGVREIASFLHAHL